MGREAGTPWNDVASRYIAREFELMGLKPVCDGVLTFRVLAYPDQALRGHMLQRAREVGLSVGAGSVALAHEAVS